MEELRASVKSSELRIPPFPSSKAAPNNEIVTDCLGGPGHDPIAVASIDEELLLEQAQQETDRIEVLRADIATAEICWLYRSKEVMIGHSQSPASDGRKYQRHLDVDEIQYQLDGKRTLITDRGALDLEPGDFVRIPVGVAFASFHNDKSEHISLVSRYPVPQVAPSNQKSRSVSSYEVDQMRNIGGAVQ